MTPERTTEIYEALSGLFVTLDKDPVSRGPAYLQDLISRTRGFLNQTSSYLQEIQRERHQLEVDLDAQEAAYDVSKSELLAEDKRVIRMPSIEDRLAMVDVLLSTERREIQRLKREIKNLGHMDKAVRHQHKELDSTMSAIRLQKQLVDAELRTGSFYGDENDASRGDAWKKNKTQPEDPLDDDDVLSLLAAAEEALSAAESPEGSSPEEVETEPAAEERAPADDDPPRDEPKAAELAAQADDPAVHRFLDEMSSDFDDLFNNL